ncbi:MAG: 4-(cytidine 5'-diphospho)-2-C-methyl-D-erythritol kinase, partial [Terriglobales bacterium]
MLPRHFTIRAFAKINLGLKIVARRPDGFHELRTVFQTIALADRLRLTVSSGRGVVVTATGWPVPAGRGNLAVRAAELAAERFGIRGRVEIALEKRIPLGAGLGGGSSDAAAVLRMLALAARRRPALSALLAAARELGSDVPLFLLGGTVLGLGRGDEVYGLPDLAPWHCVLAMPRAAAGSGLATPAAFARWDAQQRGALTEKVRSSTLMEFCSLVDQV